MEEVHVPNEVLEKAEASEIQSQAEFMSSGEVLKQFIRRGDINANQGGNYGKSF